jgi:hypothetical protein
MKKALMNIYVLALVTGSVVSVILSGCKRDETLTDPTIQNSFGKFYVNDSLKVIKGSTPLSKSDSVAFGKNEKINFTAKFSIKTAWKLSIVGKRSMAVKTITGNSSVIDATNAIWEGSSDVPVFPADTAIATLSFPNDVGRKSMSTSFKVSSSKNFAKNPNYIIVADFSKPKDTSAAAFNNDPNRNKPGFNCTSAAKKIIDGVWCFDAIGVEDFPTSYYMGGLSILPATENPGANYFPIVSPGVIVDEALTGNTYFNIWVKGYGKPVLKMSIQFNESDKGNTDFVNDPAHDDTWEYVINPSWFGWKQISFPMNMTTISQAAAYGGSGNHIREIDRIVSITIGIATDKSATNQQVEETYTFPIFSKGAAFNY